MGGLPGLPNPTTPVPPVRWFCRSAVPLRIFWLKLQGIRQIDRARMTSCRDHILGGSHIDVPGPSTTGNRSRHSMRSSTTPMQLGTDLWLCEGQTAPFDIKKATR